jgi:hypothetical protein
MAREKMAEQIARLSRQLQEVESELSERTRQNNVLRAEVKAATDALAKDADERAEEFRAQIVRLICPEKDAKSLHWDDVRQILVEREYERASLRATLVALAARVDIAEVVPTNKGKHTRDDQELLDKVDTEICGLLSDLEDLQAVPKNWRDWQELMDSDLSPDDVAAMRETLEVLGIDGWKMRYVLGHAGGPRAALKMWD